MVIFSIFSVIKLIVCCVMLDTDILIKNGGFSKEFEKNQIIFSQGDSPKYFYQIITGRVKMNNYNQEGREFIQGVFSCGESFGEPPLFIDHNYPANAIAIDPTTILMIDKLDLFEILKSNPSLCFDVFKTLSNKLLYKSTMAPVISCNDSQR
ncbi:cyclic nucleotide-binding domain-containing protein, partial [Myroides pelagicus]|nr:cyclic nucleotide-binding domain-containing protein [Myroides pelagicus]